MPVYGEQTSICIVLHHIIQACIVGMGRITWCNMMHDFPITNNVSLKHVDTRLVPSYNKLRRGAPFTKMV